MNQEEIKGVFTRCGLGNLGERLAYKLWIKGIGEGIDEEILEGFLMTFDVHDGDFIYLDEFYFHLRLFQTVVRNEELYAIFVP